MGWSVRPGHLVLIEPSGLDADACLTGLVETMPDDHTVVVDLGSSPRLNELPCTVAVSLYTPEAFYHASALASGIVDDGRVVRLEMGVIEAIPRRATRLAANLRVGVAGFNDGGSFVATTGETVDLSAGGCRVRVPDQLPDDTAAAFVVPVENQEPIVAVATIKEESKRRQGWEYRLAFLHISEEDSERLVDLA